MHQAEAALPLADLDQLVLDDDRQAAAPWPPAAHPAERRAHARATLCAPAEATTKGFPLMMADEGRPVRILAVRAGKGLALRLTDLGLNIGTELRVMQRQGGGLLVARGETRIALGAGMAAKILVAPIG